MRTGCSSRAILAGGLLLAATGSAFAQRTITADVVALDQAFYNNRLGAFQAGPTKRRKAASASAG